MKRVNEPPKIIHFGGWTAAIIGGLVFALSFGTLLYERANEPISAADLATTSQSGTCTSNETVAINNYPGLGFFSENLTHAQFESKMGGSWRCSAICVPGYDKSKGFSDQNNTTALRNFLTGAKMGTKEVNVFDSGDQFISRYNGQNTESVGDLMSHSVILANTKDHCEGAALHSTAGASIDYEKITKDNQEISFAQKNETMKKLVAAPQETSLKVGGSGSGSGGVDAPAARGTGPAGSSGVSLNDARYNYKTCMQKRYEYLNTFRSDFLPKVKAISSILYPKYLAYYNEYLRVYTDGNKKYGDSSKLDLTRATAAYKWCYQLADYEKTYGSDPTLGTGATAQTAAQKRGYTYSWVPPAKIAGATALGAGTGLAVSALTGGLAAAPFTGGTSAIVGGAIAGVAATAGYVINNWDAVKQFSGDVSTSIENGVIRAGRWIGSLFTG